MIEEILKAAGPWAVVPAASIALAGYLISMLMSWHRTRGQNRVEFLGLWRGADQMDDMALEVTVRHLFGTYLPASVIRRICVTDHCADELFNVARLWSMLRYDPISQEVSWAKPKYADKKVTMVGDFLYKMLYFLFALMAVACVFAAVWAGPNSSVAWLYGTDALLFMVMAFASLEKSETFALARKLGRQSLKRLDRRADQTPIPSMSHCSSAPSDVELAN